MVIPKSHVSDGDTLSAELASLCRAELAGYKQQRRFEYRHEFSFGRSAPRGPMRWPSLSHAPVDKCATVQIVQVVLGDDGSRARPLTDDERTALNNLRVVTSAE